MKKMFGILMFVSFVVILTSCGPVTNTSDKELAQKQEQLMTEANAQVGMPAIINFQERKLMKMIFELRDQENLICYAYIKSDYNGKLTFIGKCMGFGLPYSVQYTNPTKTVYKGQYGIEQLPQADPNGLFMPTGLSATWLMMLDSAGKPHPVYVEPEIVVSPFPLNL